MDLRVEQQDLRVTGDVLARDERESKASRMPARFSAGEKQTAELPLAETKFAGEVGGAIQRSLWWTLEQQGLEPCRSAYEDFLQHSPDKRVFSSFWFQWHF